MVYGLGSVSHLLLCLCFVIASVFLFFLLRSVFGQAGKNYFLTFVQLLF